MTTITVQALYQDGVLKPKQKIDLPEETLVQVQVTPVEVVGTPSGSLFGAFPELAKITDDDILWVKRLWEHGLEKQFRISDDNE